MAKGISIGIASDTKEFATGVKSGVIAPLEDAVDVLADVAKAGDRAGDQVGDSFDDAARSADKLEDAAKDAGRGTEAGMKEAQAATNKFEKELEDAVRGLRDVSRASRASTKDVADDFEITAQQQKTLRRKALGEIKDEAKANASETFSSFDGSAASFADGIQGTLGGLVSSLGPVGLAIGAAGALGIGLLNGAVQKGVEQTQAFKDKVGELTGQLIEAGNRGKRSFADLTSEVKSLATETDDSKTSLKDIKEISKNLDEPFKKVTTAYLNGGDALDKLIKKNQGLQDIENARLNALGAEGGFAGTSKYLNDLEQQNGVLKEQKKAIEAAQQAQLDYLNSGATEFQVKAGLIDQLNTAYDEAAGATDDFINKETGLFDVAGYITAMQARAQALADYKTALTTSGLTPEARAFLQSEGEETAAIQLQGYKNASPAQQAELNRIWSEAGKQNSGSYGAAFTAGMPKTIPGPTIELPVIAPSAFQNALRNVPKSIALPVDLFTRNGVKVP